MVAVLLAFGLAWPILMARILLLNVNEEAERQDLLGIASSCIETLHRIDNVSEARAYLLGILMGNDRLNYGTRKAVVLARLVDRDGTVVLSNALHPEDPLLRGRFTGMAPAAAVQEGHIVIRAGTPRWTLVLARHRHTLEGVLLDSWQDLSLYVLTAMPCILLPVWLAVSSGLRPLRRLSVLIATRQSDDLAPLLFDPKYAELKPLVRSLDNLLAQLRDKIEREAAFVQDAAHELRTPMAVVSAQAYVLDAAANIHERREARQLLEHAIARAAHLITQLLQLAQADASHGEPLRTVDLAQLVREEMALFAPSAISREYELSFEAPDALACTLDVPAYQLILRNLVDNAIRYGRQGGRVAVELYQQGGLIALSVADDGPGIAPEDQDRVFERFHRGTGHDAPGAGLGLAIVKQAAAKLGGTVQLSAGLNGRGCRFVVTFGA